jgi:hypothetical protein
MNDYGPKEAKRPTAIAIPLEGTAPRGAIIEFGKRGGGTVKRWSWVERARGRRRGWRRKERKEGTTGADLGKDAES